MGLHLHKMLISKHFQFSNRGFSIRGIGCANDRGWDMKNVDRALLEIEEEDEMPALKLVGVHGKNAPKAVPPAPLVFPSRAKSRITRAELAALSWAARATRLQAQG